MLASSATTFISSPPAPPAAAFGGVIELSQMLVQPEGAMPVLCLACRTINRASATVCKGCDGKLPAFYTAADAAICPTPAARTWKVPPLSGRWGTVAWLGLALALLYAAFGAWYAAHTLAARQPRTPAPPLLAAGLPASAAHAAIQPARTAEALNLTLLSSSSTAASAMPVIDPQPATRAPVRRAAAQPRMAAGASPLLQCGALSSLARALCMNNRCAQRPTARHPDCADALRQRRIDEARRNLH